MHCECKVKEIRLHEDSKEMQEIDLSCWIRSLGILLLELVMELLKI